MSKINFINLYFDQINSAINNINKSSIDLAISILNKLKKKQGRLFILGVGGSAGNASHAVNDFRKLCEIETYTPTDNVSEITARTNDEGFDTIFIEYLKISKFNKKDAILVYSVGGGNLKKNVSVNLIKAINYSKKVSAKSICIVGKNDGYAYKNCDASIFIDIANKNLITPISESMQTVIWHLFVSHPDLQSNKTKW